MREGRKSREVRALPLFESDDVTTRSDAVVSKVQPLVQPLDQSRRATTTTVTCATRTPSTRLSGRTWDDRALFRRDRVLRRPDRGERRPAPGNRTPNVSHVVSEGERGGGRGGRGGRASRSNAPRERSLTLASPPRASLSLTQPLSLSRSLSLLRPSLRSSPRPDPIPYLRPGPRLRVRVAAAGPSAGRTRRRADSNPGPGLDPGLGPGPGLGLAAASATPVPAPVLVRRVASQRRTARRTVARRRTRRAVDRRAVAAAEAREAAEAAAGASARPAARPAANARRSRGTGTRVASLSRGPSGGTLSRGSSANPPKACSPSGTFPDRVVPDASAAEVSSVSGIRGIRYPAPTDVARTSSRSSSVVRDGVSSRAETREDAHRRYPRSRPRRPLSRRKPRRPLSRRKPRRPLSRRFPPVFFSFSASLRPFRRATSRPEGDSDGEGDAFDPDAAVSRFGRTTRAFVGEGCRVDFERAPPRALRVPRFPRVPRIYRVWIYRVCVRVRVGFTVARVLRVRRLFERRLHGAPEEFFLLVQPGGEQRAESVSPFTNLRHRAIVVGERRVPVRPNARTFPTLLRRIGRHLTAHVGVSQPSVELEVASTSSLFRFHFDDCPRGVPPLPASPGTSPRTRAA